MIRIKRGFWSFLFFLFFLPIPQLVYAQRDPLEGLDSYIKQAMKDWQAPGLAIAVVKDDAVVFLQGFGVLEEGKDIPLDAQTVLPLDSITKPFTAMAAGILVDECKLSWDDPIIKHLPWFQLPDPWVTRHATLRDMLSHRVGGDLGRHLWIFGLQSFDPKEELRSLSQLEIAGFLPRFRTGVFYHNMHFSFVGEVVAEVSGMSWAEFVKVTHPAALGDDLNENEFV